MTHVLELPNLSCKVLGEVKHIDECASKNHELYLHFANMKPPDSFNFGPFFSLSSASNKPSFSLSVIGTMSRAQWLK